jgi:dihydroxyacid dehydratase/phosphogluconate dehydratase
MQTAFKAGELHKDVIVVVRFQGPRANGMPELHKLTPPLGVLQDKGFKVALVTDGRMSGASGKVPAAIHVTPEALADSAGVNGPLAYLRDGDIVRLCAETGALEVLTDISGREPAARHPSRAWGVSCSPCSAWAPTAPSRAVRRCWRWPGSDVRRLSQPSRETDAAMRQENIPVASQLQKSVPTSR